MRETETDGEAAPEVGATPSAHTRAVGAWRSWLGALASDAEAAFAAAMTYAALPDAARDAWLDALERDRRLVDAPAVALYAPLLAVEDDHARRARMGYAMKDRDDRGALQRTSFGRSGTAALPATPAASGALRGRTASGDLVCAVATPLYLDFVELLVCRYDPDRGVFAAHHDPFRNAAQLTSSVASALEEAISLQPAALRDVIEELAHAVVADRRMGRSPPEALARFSHLFCPDLSDDVPSA
jgi:hypothetical protein